MRQIFRFVGFCGDGEEGATTNRSGKSESFLILIKDYDGI